MDQTDRQLLHQLATLVVEQAATLAEYRKVTEIASLEMQSGYVAQVRRSKPPLDHISKLVQLPSTDREIFDTLRKLLVSVTTPAL